MCVFCEMQQLNQGRHIPEHAERLAICIDQVAGVFKALTQLSRDVIKSRGIVTLDQLQIIARADMLLAPLNELQGVAIIDSAEAVEQKESQGSGTKMH